MVAKATYLDIELTSSHRILAVSHAVTPTGFEPVIIGVKSRWLDRSPMGSFSCVHKLATSTNAI